MTKTHEKTRLSFWLTVEQLDSLETLAAQNQTSARLFVRELIGNAAKKAGLPWTENAFRYRSPNGTNKRLAKKSENGDAAITKCLKTREPQTITV